MAHSQSTWSSLGSFSLSQWTISKGALIKNLPSVRTLPQVRCSDPDLLYLFQITTGHFTTRLPAVCLTSALSIFERHTSNNTDPILIPEPNLYHVFWQQMLQFVDKKAPLCWSPASISFNCLVTGCGWNYIKLMLETPRQLLRQVRGPGPGQDRTGRIPSVSPLKQINMLHITEI